MMNQDYVRRIADIGEALEIDNAEPLKEYLAELLDDNFEQHHEQVPSLYENVEDVRKAFDEYVGDLHHVFYVHSHFRASRTLYDFVDDLFFRDVCRLCKVKRYWVSENNQASFGAWQLHHSAELIWRDIKEQIDKPAGTLRVGEYTE